MTPSQTEKSKAIVLIDPVSSGRFLKAYVPKSGYKLIGVFTLSEEELKGAGKHIPHAEKVEFCDAVIYCDQVDRLLEQLAELPFEPAAVIPASEPGVELADQIAERLGLRGNPVSSSLARRDKYETRLAIQKAGLRGPEFAACKTREEALAFASAQALPVVVKTPKGAGAHHVFICDNLKEVASAFDRVVREPNVFGDPASFALLEDFISGRQYAVELFGDGENLHLVSIWGVDFRKNALGKSFFEKTTMVTDLKELESLNEVREYAIAVGRAVGVQWGPCLVELKYDPVQGPSLIEVGARLSGIDIPVLVRESSNFDPFQATMDAYLSQGVYTVKPVLYLKHASLVFFPVDGHGTVEEIHGIDEIERMPSYLMHHLYTAPGESIPPTSDLATVPLYVYLAHKDKAQLIQDMAEIKKVFKIKWFEHVLSRT
jgi:biotin carboxylase